MAEGPPRSLTQARPNEDVTSGHHVDEWQDIRLRYKLAPSSFMQLLTICKSPTREDVFRKACFCTEFQTFPLLPEQKAFFRAINDNSPIPYRVSESISAPWHKVFLLVQIDLSGNVWPNKISSCGRKELHAERGRMYKILDQVLRCIIDILGHRKDGRGVTVGLDVLRSVKAGVWEGNEKELLQVEGIGQAKAQKLIDSGIRTIRQLAKLEFYHIERLLSRNPPFGQQILHHLAGFPLLDFSVQAVHPRSGSEAGHTLTDTRQCQFVLRLTLRYENVDVPIWRKHTPWTTLVVEGDDGRLLWFWRGSVKRLVGRKEILVRIASKLDETLQVTFAYESIVGTLQRHRWCVK